MSIKKIIFKNTIWLAIAEVISKLSAFIILAWMARYYGPEIFGKWSWAMSFVSLFIVFADFGFSTLTIREISRDKNKTSQYIDNIFIMKLILGIITLGLIFIVVQFFNQDQETLQLVYALGFYVVISTFFTFFQGIFRANEKIYYEALAQFIQNIILVSLVAFFILNKAPILNIGFAYSLGALAGILFSLFFIWRYFTKFFKKIDFGICKEILSQAWPFALSFIAITIYYFLDQVMLGLMKTKTDVGLYNSAYKILLLILTGQALIYNAVFPIVSRLYKESKKDYLKIINTILKLAPPTALLIILFISFFGDEVIILIFGSEYLLAAVPLKILIWNLLIICLSGVFGTLILSVANKQKLFMYGVGSGALINIVLNLILIPPFSIIGAAVATVLSEIIVLIVMYSLSRNIFKDIKLSTKKQL